LAHAVHLPSGTHVVAHRSGSRGSREARRGDSESPTDRWRMIDSGCCWRPQRCSASAAPCSIQRRKPWCGPSADCSTRGSCARARKESPLWAGRTWSAPGPHQDRFQSVSTSW